MTTPNGWTVEMEKETGRVIIGVPGLDTLGTLQQVQWTFSHAAAQSLAQQIQEVSRAAV